MFFTHLILASLAVTTAVSSHHFKAPNPHVFNKRQEYQPTELQCGIGETCEESCGAGYLLCSDPNTFLCYNPDLAHTCCEPGSAASWGCPNGDYCFIGGYCCPHGIDPQACALVFSITLPATFVSPTATPNVSNMTSAVTTRTLASISLPIFTGAATTSDPIPSATVSALPPDSATPSLSINAKIAIGAICGVVGMALILLGMFCLLRTRKRSETPAKPQSVHTAANNLPTLESNIDLSRGEMMGMSELDDAPANRLRVELA